MLTDPDDLVLDPFAGSLTTGAVSEGLERRWIAGEAVEEYLQAGRFRFEEGSRNPFLF
jgi:site-specific DNA-methyltransferase (cytosine-N4-specific)